MTSEHPNKRIPISSAGTFGEPAPEKQTCRAEQMESSAFKLDGSFFQQPTAEESAFHFVASDEQPGDLTEKIELFDGEQPEGPGRDSGSSPAPATDFESGESAFLHRMLGSLRFLVPALLIVGLVFFGFKHEDFFKELAGSRSSQTAPETTSTGTDAVDAPRSSATPAVRSPDRIAVPIPPAPRLVTKAAKVSAKVPAKVSAKVPVTKRQRKAALVPTATKAVPAMDKSNLSVNLKKEEESLFTLAAENRLVGEDDKAEQIYRRLLREGRQPGRAALALGDLLLAKDRPREAYEMYGRSKRLYSQPVADSVERE